MRISWPSALLGAGVGSLLTWVAFQVEMRAALRAHREMVRWMRRRFGRG